MATTAIDLLRGILNGFRDLNSKGIYSMNATETDLLRQILTEVQALSLGATVADGSITAVKLASDAVTTAKILDANVTTSKLASDAVTTAKILDANVTTAKIADANVTPVKLSQPFTRGTAVATTSGTAIDFTGIPSWVKRITLIFNGVSTNGTAYPRIQLGSGSVSTSGYLASSSSIGSGSAASITSTGGIDLFSNLATYTINGQAVFTNISGNTWIGTMVGDYNGAVAATLTAIGSITLGGTLDRIRLTTSNGTNTFDAGSINIFYE